MYSFLQSTDYSEKLDYEYMYIYIYICLSRPPYADRKQKKMVTLKACHFRTTSIRTPKVFSNLTSFLYSSKISSIHLRMQFQRALNEAIAIWRAPDGSDLAKQIWIRQVSMGPSYHRVQFWNFILVSFKRCQKYPQYKFITTMLWPVTCFDIPQNSGTHRLQHI